VDGLNELLGEKMEISDWAQLWTNAEKQAFDAFNAAPSFAGKIVVDALRDLPAHTRLVVANSLPIRHIEEWMPVSTKPLRVFANRGVSGIDGTISTALGVASATDAPTLLVTGDLSFFHDQNGLQALQNGDLKITILLINNQGGGIFHRLPIAEYEPPFEEMFITPHELDFSHTAKLYGLNYELIDAEYAAEKVASAMTSSGSQILELRTDSAHGEKVRREIFQKIKG
jgi:2-succinyl-5-enolpyruvyl-6-hydroxy-3-cyclohexene-1-carboxylate synthase